jgi:hypothetical protein
MLYKTRDHMTTHRLPTPGSDSGTWGDILNDFLVQAHNSDGTLNPNSVGTAQLQLNSVAAGQLQDGSVTDVKLSITAAIAKSKLATSVQISLAAADSSVQSVNAKAPASGAITLTASDVGAPLKPVAAADGKTLRWNNNLGQLEDATTALNAAYAPLATTGRSDTGISIPAGWGSFWRAKRALAGAGTGKATIAVVGDSVAWGAYSSNPSTKGWASLVRIALQTAYGDGGSGYVGVQNALAVMSALGVSSAARTAYGAAAAVTGTWASNGGFGIGNVSISSATTASTITFTVRGTAVSMYYVTNPGNATFNWSIDGVAQTAVSTNASGNMGRTTVTGLATGSHTVVISQPGTSNLFICGCAGENASGIVLNNFSTFGATSANYNNTDSFGGVAKWSGGSGYPADLNVYALSLNSAGAGVAGDGWIRDVHRYLQQVKNVAAPASDVLIVMEHIGNADNATPVYQEYVSRIQDLAAAYGAGLINLWTLGRNSYNYWAALNYWSVEDGTGGPGSSAQHPSDLGHAFIAGQILSILLSA